MGRIRTIKPEFPQSESMGRCSRDARLLFIMLWTMADDEGRARAAPRMLASLLYPYDDDAGTHLTQWLFELERQGCIQLYEHGGNAYLQIDKWLEHQRIDKPSKSKLPAPADKPREHSQKPREASAAEGNGKEGNGRDQLPDKPGKNVFEYPEDFQAFWKAYPTDQNMPKKPAYQQWKRLSEEKRAQAMAAIAGFKAYCEKNKSWYRTIYAERFLSQEKFEGYIAASLEDPSLDPAELAALTDRIDQKLKRGKYAENYA